MRFAAKNCIEKETNFYESERESETDREKWDAILSFICVATIEDTHLRIWQMRTTIVIVVLLKFKKVRLRRWKEMNSSLLAFQVGVFKFLLVFRIFSFFISILIWNILMSSLSYPSFVISSSTYPQLSYRFPKRLFSFFAFICRLKMGKDIFNFYRTVIIKKL